MTDESACNCYRPWSGGRFPIKEPCPVHSTTSSVPARCGSMSKSVIAKLQEIANQYPAHIFTVEGRTSDGIAGTAIRERMLAEIRMLQEQNASSAQTEPWKCPSCRSICDPAWKRCPYCPDIEASPSQETGRCGDPAPRLTLGGEVVGSPVHCRLPAGHDGWHRGDDRSEWSAGDERAQPKRYWVGYYCPRGSGHYEIYGQPEYTPECGSKGWDVYLDAEEGDEYLPEGEWR